jgi:hypothetical protein
MEKMIQSREEEDFYKLLTVAAIESSLQGLIVSLVWTNGQV